MASEGKPDLTLFLDILQTLERIGAPYMIIGGFAGIMYGVNRTTFDIDIVVDLHEEHIESLAATYPGPRYYADPEQMRRSIRMGMSFNIIDGKRGEKADLSPLTRDSRYRAAFDRRMRQVVMWEGSRPFEAWCARPDDVIYGKFLAWDEGRSRKHETDIYDMLVLKYLAADPLLEAGLDEEYLDAAATALGPDVSELWVAIKQAARAEAARAGSAD